MPIIERLLTLNEAATKKASRGKKFDFNAFKAEVPSLEIVGDSDVVCVHVRLDKTDEGALLRAATNHNCVVDEYATLDPSGEHRLLTIEQGRAALARASRRSFT